MDLMKLPECTDPEGHPLTCACPFGPRAAGDTMEVDKLTMDEQENCPLCKKPLTDDTVSYVMSIYYHSTCLGDALSKLGSGEYSLVSSVWLLEQRLHTISLECESLAEQMNKKQEEYNRLKDQLAQAKEREKKRPSTPVDFNTAP